MQNLNGNEFVDGSDGTEFPDIHAIGNAIEGMVWIVVAVILIFPRTNSLHRAECALAAAAFFAFGISDFVEIRTGAWWEPWWLLAWKAICVVGFVTAWLIYKRRKAEGNVGR